MTIAFIDWLTFGAAAALCLVCALIIVGSLNLHHRQAGQHLDRSRRDVRAGWRSSERYDLCATPAEVPLSRTPSLALSWTGILRSQSQ